MTGCKYLANRQRQRNLVKPELHRYYPFKEESENTQRQAKAQSSETPVTFFLFSLFLLTVYH